MFIDSALKILTGNSVDTTFPGNCYTCYKRSDFPIRANFYAK